MQETSLSPQRRCRESYKLHLTVMLGHAEIVADMESFSKRTRNNWWHRSQHLKACGLHKVNMTDADKAALQRLFEMRLGAPAFQLTKMRLTTNKNEAANRAISASLQKKKKLKFSLNAQQGRLCSVMDRMNYGAGVPLLRKLESVQCPITIGGGGVSHKQQKQIQNEGEYQRAYRRQPSVKLYARYAKFRRVSNYFAAKRNRRQVDIYKKCQLDVRAARTKGKNRRQKNVSAVKPVLKEGDNGGHNKPTVSTLTHCGH